MTPWTVAHQAPLSMGILQARKLEWVAMQGIFPTQVLNPGLLHCVQTLYCLSAQGKHGGREQTSKRTRSAYSSDELISLFSCYNLGEKKTLNNHPSDKIHHLVIKLITPVHHVSTLKCFFVHDLVTFSAPPPCNAPSVRY